MRNAATHFQQVPKAVIERLLAQQQSRAESERAADEAVEKWAASEVQARKPKP